MRIRELRRGRQLTGTTLAQACGVTLAAVTGWEDGSSRPTADKLPVIAATLGCEVGDLYTAEELKHASEAAMARIHAKAVADARKLSEEGEGCREST